jgi:hypothetical protein
MRTHKTATLAIAAALTLGAAGTATAAFASDDSDQQVVAAPAARQQLAEQVRILQRTNEAVKPVNSLLQAVIDSQNGQLSRAQADRHAQAVERGLNRLVRAVRDLQADPAYQQSARQNSDRFASARLTAKAADQVQQHVDKLIKQARAGHEFRVQRQARALVKSEVNLMTSIVLGGQVPAPDMEGLPEIQLPQNADQRPYRDQQNNAENAPVG